MIQKVFASLKVWNLKRLSDVLNWEQREAGHGRYRSSTLFTSSCPVFFSEAHECTHGGDKLNLVACLQFELFFEIICFAARSRRHQFNCCLQFWFRNRNDSKQTSKCRSVELWNIFRSRERTLKAVNSEISKWKNSKQSRTFGCGDSSQQCNVKFKELAS